MNTFALVDYLADLLIEDLARESDVAQGKTLADNGAHVSSCHLRPVLDRQATRNVDCRSSAGLPRAGKRARRGSFDEKPMFPASSLACTMRNAGRNLPGVGRQEDA